MREHSVNVLGGILVATLIIAIALGGYFYMENREQKASADLGAAIETLNARIGAADPNPDSKEESYSSVKERGQAAEKKLQSIASQYPHTHAGKISRYLSGVSQEIQKADPKGPLGQQAMMKMIGVKGGSSQLPVQIPQ